MNEAVVNEEDADTVTLTSAIHSENDEPSNVSDVVKNYDLKLKFNEMKELRVEILAQPNKILRHTSNFQVLTLADLGDLLI